MAGQTLWRWDWQLALEFPPQKQYRHRWMQVGAWWLQSEKYMSYSTGCTACRKRETSPILSSM